MHTPRLVISGLSGGAGKTMLSLGLTRALVRTGARVRAFKKGPDYIDAAWLALAARAPQGNLDPYFCPADQLRSLFLEGSAGYDLAMVEGNRGLFDGLDLTGSCSTAEVARILRAPVLLILDCTKMTRTAAAVVQGCAHFEPGVTIGGVVLNRTGNPRHRAMVRSAVEELAGVPVLGVLPRLKTPLISERHMGLAGACEHERADDVLDRLADFIGEYVDVWAVRDLAATDPALPMGIPRSIVHADAESHPLCMPDASTGSAPWRSPSNSNCDPCTVTNVTAGYLDEGSVGPSSGKAENAPHSGGNIGSVISPVDLSRNDPLAGTESALAPRGLGRNPGPRIGYVYDAAFWFYYRENLDALTAAGARLVPVSLLDERPWPVLDGLYIGGGLPELHAEALSANQGKKELVASLSQAGLPVYAECGGFMYLAKSLHIEGRAYPMAGVFSCSVEFLQRPQGLGYVEATVVGDNPFHPRGLRFRGHEFHFSHCLDEGISSTNHILSLSKGKGMALDHKGRGLDGMLVNATFASYMHVYAPALPSWAKAFTGLCQPRRAGAP